MPDVYDVDRPWRALFARAVPAAYLNFGGV